MLLMLAMRLLMRLSDSKALTFSCKVRSFSLAQQFERDCDLFGDPVHREITSQLHTFWARDDARASKLDFWKLLGVEEVGAAQMLIAFRVVGVHRCRIDVQ